MDLKMSNPPSSVSPNNSGGKPVVCFLGPVASYTHQATLEAFPSDQYELMPVVTIKDIFDTTQSGAAKYGVVPFENSTNGSVLFTLDHLADRQDEYRDLSVCAEIYLDVHHCLLGHLPPSPSSSSPPSTSGQCTPTPTHPNPSSSSASSQQQQQQQVVAAKPLHSLSHVKRIYSHPQAFGQCTRFLSTHLRGIETVDVSSTSKAAELVEADLSGETAAISSAIAAKLLNGDDDDDGTAVATATTIDKRSKKQNKIEILARNIEDRDDNTTRFFVLRKGLEEEGGGGGGNGLSSGLPKNLLTCPSSTSQQQQQRTSSSLGDDKSLLSFTVATHETPGALADVLECFRRRGLSLTSINSRPSLRKAFQYIFFVEFEGHRFRDDDDSSDGSPTSGERVRGVLEDVKGVAQESRWLGSWVNMLKGR